MDNWEYVSAAMLARHLSNLGMSDSLQIKLELIVNTVIGAQSLLKLKALEQVQIGQAFLKKLKRIIKNGGVRSNTPVRFTILGSTVGKLDQRLLNDVLNSAVNLEINQPIEADAELV
ncbi:MAG: hypothetical protein NT141_01385 [candidate division WWE3 bacterium]|nr:hypothetical protein [candidate division WWE3 bacterium]